MTVNIALISYGMLLTHFNPSSWGCFYSHFLREICYSDQQHYITPHLHPSRGCHGQCVFSHHYCFPSMNSTLWQVNLSNYAVLCWSLCNKAAKSQQVWLSLIFELWVSTYLVGIFKYKALTGVKELFQTL